MSDLFHPAVPCDFIDKVFAVMAAAPLHTFQVLTKRPDRMAEYMAAGSELWLGRWSQAIGEVTGTCQVFAGVPPNVWLGTSVEDEEAMGRIEELRAARADVRFLSLEPLIGPLPALDLSGIHWVIVGGESGRNARPMKEQWVLDIRKQCRAADVPFFFKQWGAHDARGRKVGKKSAGRLLDGQTWDQMPPLAAA